MTAQEKAYGKALQELRDKNYLSAVRFFESIENQFAKNREFHILYESTKLLLAVKEEIYILTNDKVLG